MARAMGGEQLRDVEPEAFYAELTALRGRCHDRALQRAIHFFEENARVERAVAALEAGEREGFLDAIRASGASSWTLLQNIWSPSSLEEQPIGLALALSDRLLAGDGASRVHGGGFAGTMQAFVPEAQLEDYIAGMARVFGDDAVLPIMVREAGAGACPL